MEPTDSTLRSESNSDQHKDICDGSKGMGDRCQCHNMYVHDIACAWLVVLRYFHNYDRTKARNACESININQWSIIFVKAAEVAIATNIAMWEHQRLLQTESRVHAVPSPCSQQSNESRFSTVYCCNHRLVTCCPFKSLLHGLCQWSCIMHVMLEHVKASCFQHSILHNPGLHTECSIHNIL